MTRVLVLYTSTHGHTGKIAARIADTDTSRDHDFTDWDDVDRFGAECAGLVAVVSP